MADGRSTGIYSAKEYLGEDGRIHQVSLEDRIRVVGQGTPHECYEYTTVRRVSVSSTPGSPSTRRHSQSVDPNPVYEPATRGGPTTGPDPRTPPRRRSYEPWTPEPGRNAGAGPSTPRRQTEPAHSPRPPVGGYYQREPAWYQAPPPQPYAAYPSAPRQPEPYVSDSRAYYSPRKGHRKASEASRRENNPWSQRPPGRVLGEVTEEDPAPGGSLPRSPESVLDAPALQDQRYRPLNDYEQKQDEDRDRNEERMKIEKWLQDQPEPARSSKRRGRKR